MKSPYDFLAKLSPPSTPEDEAEARRLGVSLEEYRAIKLQVPFEQAKSSADETAPPDDIAAEEAKAKQLHRDPGIIKARYTAPNILTQAAKTPGEVAKMIIFVGCYVIEMAGIVILGGERVQKIPGIFQFVALGLLVIPTMFITDRIWEAIGERARDLIRTLVRFWPLTLLALLFALVFLKVIARSRLH